MRLTDTKLVKTDITKDDAELFGKVAAYAFMVYCDKVFGDSKWEFKGKPIPEYSKALQIPSNCYHAFECAYTNTVMFGLNEDEKKDVLYYCGIYNPILFDTFKKILVG